MQRLEKERKYFSPSAKEGTAYTPTTGPQKAHGNFLAQRVALTHLTVDTDYIMKLKQILSTTPIISKMFVSFAVTYFSSLQLNLAKAS